jgi:hypothetical protein
MAVWLNKEKRKKKKEKRKKKKEKLMYIRAA